MADLQTLLNKFLQDLYAGVLGSSITISGETIAATGTYGFVGISNGLNVSSGNTQLKAADGGAYFYVSNGVVTVNSASLQIANAGNSVAQITNTSSLTTAAVAGLAVTNVGEFRRLITKLTLTSTHAAYQAAAVTADVTLATLPAKARLVGIIADTTVAWAGPAGTLAFTVGKTAGGAEYVGSHDVKTAAVTKGLADADLGTSLTRATAIQGGDLPSWTATTALQCRLTSGTGNLGTGAATNLTQGTTVFYLISETHP